MPEEIQPQPSPAGAMPDLPPELWFKSMFEGSWTLASYQSLQLVKGSAFEKRMQREFERWITSGNETTHLVEDIFYSYERKKIFWGQLSYDLLTGVISPVLPNNDQKLRSFHTQNNSFYITSENVVYGCGLNKRGELGLGHTNPVHTPTRIPFFTGIPIKTIVVCDQTRITFFLNTNGEVFVCGGNDCLIALAGVNQALLPRMINTFPAGTRFKKIEILDHQIFFITSNNEVFALGDNYYGQLGLGLMEDAPRPTKIIEFRPNAAIEKIVTGNFSTFFITSSGEVFACGYNPFGKLGLGHTDNVREPTRIEALNGIAIEDISIDHTCTFFITPEGRVYVSGQNYLIRSELENIHALRTPQLLPALQNDAIKQIVIVSNAVFFLTDKGQVLMSDLAKLAPVEALQHEIVVKIQKLRDLHNNDFLVFITLNGTIIEFTIPLHAELTRLIKDGSRFTTRANFHLSLPEEITAPAEALLALKQLKLKQPVGWFYHPTGWPCGAYTSSYEKACSRGEPQPVFMTTQLLSYPMRELKNTLSRSDITSAAIDIAKNKCNDQFRDLLFHMKTNMETEPLLSTHINKSITPKVMELVLAYLDENNTRGLIKEISNSQLLELALAHVNQDNIGRLILHMSRPQIKHLRNLTERAPQKYETKGLRYGWNSRRADRMERIRKLHDMLLERQRANP